MRFLLLLLLLESLLPLLLPRPLLWLLLQLPAAKHHGPKGGTESKIYVLRSERPFTKSLLLVRKVSFFTILLISFLPYCYCCCWTHMLPLLLPRPLLWLLLQLPAAKHHGPKGRTASKIYVSRGRNVSSEILQKACRCYCHGRCSGCCRSSRQQNTMALKDEPSPKYTFPGAGTSLLKSYKKLAAATATAAALAAAAAPGNKTPWP